MLENQHVINLEISKIQLEEIVKRYGNSNALKWEFTTVEPEELNKLQDSSPELKTVGEISIHKYKIRFELYRERILLRYQETNTRNLPVLFTELLQGIEAIDDLLYGIKKEMAHHRSKRLIPEDFFWSSIDELAPFGSDEGDLALEEYRNWRSQFPRRNLVFLIEEIIDEIGEFDFTDYQEERVLSADMIAKHEDDKEFDTYYNYFVLDSTIIASGFGQLVDEGKIDEEAIPIIKTSIRKLRKWNRLQEKEWDGANEFTSNLDVLYRVINSLEKDHK